MGFFKDLINGFFGGKDESQPTNVYVQSKGLDTMTLIIIMIPIMLLVLITAFKK